MTRTALFAGSFDPPTLGHLDLVERARGLVDRLVVGVGRNADKSSWLPLSVRLELLRAVLPEDVEVIAFEGLAVAALRELGGQVLVRGVRSGGDAEAELRMAHANRILDDGVETVLLPSHPSVAHVSSRLVREVWNSGGEVGHFVPDAVVRALQERRAP